MLGLSRLRIGLLSSSASSIGGGGSFSPLSLFASGEQGAWYDPSDLSTMFQDTAGTTPVTATGQTVGLLLDKSKGLVLGPELVTNGTFDTNVNGWTAGFGTSSTSLAWSNGAAVVTVVAGFSNNALGRYVGTISGLTIGASYRLQFGTFSATGPAVIGWTSSSNGTGGAEFSSGQTTARIVTATATTMYVYFGFSFASTGNTLTVDNISVKELPGNHATQATAASRPQYQVDGNGKAYLLFDGTDDFMLTGTITPGIDKAQVFAGVRKLSDAAIGMVAETSSNAGSNNGSLYMAAPLSTGASSDFAFSTRGTSSATAVGGAALSPISRVLTGIGDIAADTSIIRINGAQAAQSTADQGTGNYLAYPLYIGRRNGTQYPFNGRIYQMLVRFGANLSAAQISQMETWLNARTGAF